MAEQSGSMESSFANDNIRAERERLNDLIRQMMLAELPTASARLVDRGIDPRPIIGTDYEGNAMSVAQFYLLLRAYSVTEKAGQDPTYKGARVAIASDLSPRVRDAAFVALNQQSAEEAGHGDKVFGAAYYEMGGVAPTPLPEEQLNNGGDFLEPVSDPAINTQKVLDMMAILGGVETLALERAFPLVLDACSRWNHPLASQLVDQVNRNVKPEEARHVLTWRYLFHQGVAPRGEDAIERYFMLTNWGRDRFLAPRMERREFERHMKASCPTTEQLIGRPLPVSI
ncbi:MAG: hypothetical protein WCD12_05145 [Candidatus Binatus sp.]|uniref:hypothetical protein n=1 Tax=Candidatus Binatus sp. TaxID=2811406 RepID=UPI003C732C23